MGTVGSNPTPSASYIAAMRTHRLLASFIALGAVLAMTSTASAGPSSDQEIADGSVLTIDDVPQGFEEEEPEDTEEPALPVCKAIKKSADILNDNPNTEVEFGAGSGNVIAIINNQVSVIPTVKKARRVARAYLASNAGDCLAQTFDKQLEENTGGEATVELDPSDPSGGDEAAGYEGTIEVTADGDSATFHVDVQLFRVGRAIAAFFFLNAGNPPPPDDVEEMVDTVLTRLEDSL
jgi:hypothetical protein